jgi:hypothetical protein
LANRVKSLFQRQQLSLFSADTPTIEPGINQGKRRPYPDPKLRVKTQYLSPCVPV